MVIGHRHMEPPRITIPVHDEVFFLIRYSVRYERNELNTETNV